MARDILRNFMNDDGQITQWPAKLSNQQLVLTYLANKFTPDRLYSESEVNDILNQWHTFQDWAILRRALVDGGYMSRDRSGSAYRQTITKNPQA